ncbi:MAG: hypothetical protein ACYTGP_11570 [Planctomycetota bacterium]|jgi:hypothetical protein
MSLALVISLLAAAPASAKVVNIEPSNDMTGQTDYEVLQAAFLDATPGTKIRLEAGTYYLNHVLFADDFRGVFEGAGKGDTIITSVGVLDAWPAGEGFPWLIPPSLDHPWPSLISFVDGRFTVRDMTFRITEEIPMVFEMFGSQFELMAGVIYILGNDPSYPVSSTITRVGFEGAPGTYGGYNVVQAVYHNGLIGDLLVERGFPLTGKHYVTQCSFETFFAGNAVYYLAEDATLKVQGNTFTDVVAGLEVIDTNGRITFMDNAVSAHPSAWGDDGAGVLVLQGLYTLLDGAPPVAPLDLSVRNNQFYVDGAVAALDLEDWQFAFVGTAPSLFVDVRQNEIHADSSLWGLYTFGLTDPREIQNTFDGLVTEAGLNIELTSEGRFMHNDVQFLQADMERCVLQADTFDNLVMCPDAFEDVLDLTDDPMTPEYDGLNRIVSVGN